MQYKASTINRTALPRSKRMRALGAASVTPTVVNGESGDKYWYGEIDTETEETEVSTIYPVKISKRLRIVDESGALHGDISIDANGRFVFDKGIISKEDIIAYGVGGSDIKSVTDVIEEYLAEHGVGGYEPPVGGIPRSDLSSSVQTSLEKADTALQEHQSLQGYATERWVEGKGYLTAHQDISGKSNTTHTHSVKINGVTKTIAASGGAAVDLGTYLTSHQDISGKADKTSTVSTVSYDATNKKITKTINGTTSDVVSVSTLKSAMSLAKGDVGLGNVNNTADADKNVEGANHILSLGKETMIAGTTKPTKTGISLVEVYNNGYPSTYGNIINVHGQGSGQLLCEWTSSNATGHLKYRSLRDTIDGWSDWKTVAFTDDNVASATKLQTARTLWGQSFNGSDDVNGYVIINNGYGVEGKDTGGTARTLLILNASNQVSLAYGTAGAGYDTYINGNNIIFRLGPGHAEKMCITSDGNVGIGTTAPSQKLEVNGNAAVRGAIYLANDANYYSGYISTASDRMEILAPTDSGANARPLYLGKRGGTRYMALLNNGNVGIGIDEPTYKLHVNGKVRAGSVSANGTIDAVGSISIKKGTYGTRASFNYGNDTGRWDIAVDGDSDAMRWETTNAAGNAWETGNRLKLDRSGNLTAGGNIIASGNVKIQSGGYLHSAYQSDAPIVKDHSNGNVTINAVGTSSAAGELFLGYYNTKKLNFYAGTTRSNSVAETQIGAWDISGMTINASSANGLVIKRTVAASGAFVNYFNNNQSSNAWRVGMNNDNKFAWTYSTDGLSSGTGRLALDTSGNLVAVGDVTAYSDKRLKSDIKDLEYRGPLEPKTYIKDGKKSIGFIAQEVRELYPELVLGEEKKDEYLSLNYGAITAVLAAENKELRNEVTELKNEVEELKKLINKLIEK